MNILHTTTDAIRAALGLTDRELKDTQISDLGIESMLEIELSTVYPDHAGLAQKIQDSTATPEEAFVWKVLLQYEKYQCAVFLLPQIQMLVVQRISDGDAEMARFQTDNLQDTIDRITGMRDRYLNALDELMNRLQEFFNPFSTVAPDYDPVTNDGAV